MAFDRDEYAGRVDRTRASMAAANVDLLIVDEGELLCYLTGFDISDTRYRACLIPARGDPVMIVRHLDVGLFQSQAWFDECVGFRDWDDPFAALVTAVDDRGWPRRRVGLDFNSYCMTAHRFGRLTETLRGADFVDMSTELARLRWRKSASEIALLRQAAGIADASMAAVIEAAEPGVRERDVAAATSANFVRLGADHGRTGPMRVSSGWDFLHANISDRALTAGDILHVELVPMVRGYSARLMRPIMIGAVPSDHARSAAQIIDIQDRQIAAMDPGTPAREVDRLCRQGMLEAGLRQDYHNVTGYALGYYSRTGPRASNFDQAFMPSADWLLEEGMVFHMYTSAAGLAFSETVLVTDTGPERLTRTDRSILEGP
jgi:Xaa-Pro aminopeptidase